MSNELFDLEKRPLSFSSLKQFDKSAQHYVAYRNKVFVPTADMNLGTAFHTLTLQEEEFKKQYFVLDDAEIVASIDSARPTSTTVYKEWKKEQLSEAGEREMMSPKDYDLIQRMRDAVREHKEANEILTACTQFEKKVTWNNFCNLEMTGYLDGFGPDIFMDLKSTREPDPYWFGRDFFKMFYHAQAAVYDDGLDENFNPVSNRKIIAVGKADPLSVSVHNISQDVVNLGRDEYHKWCGLFIAFKKDPEKYATAYPGVNEIQIPKWLQGDSLDVTL